MKHFVGFLIWISICWACGNPNKDGERADSISGTYVREFSREILSQSNGAKMGMRTVRDTLYVTFEGDGYKVRNTRWSMNDYDDDGWRDMEHAEGGPLASFTATYDEASRTLTSGSAPKLVIAEDGRISVGGKSEIAYSKID